MRTFLFIFFAISFFNLQAQVKGRVTDAQSGVPMPYATVSLFSSSDSLLIDGTITDEMGQFSMEVQPGDYFAKLEFLAYEPFFVEKITVKNAPLDLGNIRLDPSATTLNEVVVQAEKSTMQMSLDKKIFNVGKDLGNAGGNAADLLSNIPSISVDVEGNVSLRGSSGVRILIDGKPSGLVSFNGAAGLQQLQGSLIDRVEIITNPSARYEAEGVGGIINIILKKERTDGFNGSVDLVAGNPTNYGVALNLNYRKERLNFFINYGISYRNSPGKGSIYQRVFGGDTTYIYNQTNDREIIGFNQNIRGGLDYYFNDKNILTAAYTFRRSDANRLTDLVYTDYIFDENNPTSISTRLQDEDEVEPNSEYALSYKRTFNRKDQELNAEIRIFDNWEDSNQDFTERFYNPDFTPSGIPDLLQNSYNYESEKQYLLQVDYVQPFAKEGKIEGGVRSSFRNMLNDYQVTQLNDGDWESLPGLDNKFLYDEQIHAAYGIFGNKTKKDLQQSNEILREVVRTDNDIINVLNRAVDFKTYEKVNLNYNVNENSQQLENLTRATDTLEKQVMFLKKENTTLQEDAKWAKAKIITLLIALMIMILFIRRKRKQF